MNPTSIFLPTMIFIPVVNRKTCTSFGMSMPLTNSCKNLNASLSPSLHGFDIKQEGTFFTVGLRESDKASVAGSYFGTESTFVIALQKAVE